MEDRGVILKHGSGSKTDTSKWSSRSEKREPYKNKVNTMKAK